MEGDSSKTSVQQSSTDGSSVAIPIGSPSKIQPSTNIDGHEPESPYIGPEAQTESSETIQYKDICSITGQRHLNLRQFAIKKCPQCLSDLPDNDLGEDPHPRPHASVPGQERDSELAFRLSQIQLDVQMVKRVTDKIREEASIFGSSDELSDHEMPGGEMEKESREFLDHGMPEDEMEEASRESILLSSQEQESVFQKLEFQNYDGKIISSQTWKGAFDIDQARQNVTRRGIVDKRIARMTILLKTDLLTKKKLKSSMILRDPDIEITEVERELHITSRPFINALKQCVLYYPDAEFSTTELKMKEPFPLVAHHATELLRYKSTFLEQSQEVEDEGLNALPSFDGPLHTRKCSDIAHQHIGTLLSYLGFDGQTGPFQKELDRHQRDVPVCTFGMLWLLYKPGTTVYHQSEDRTEALIIQKVERGLSFDGNESPYVLVLWQLCYDGHRVRRGNKTVVISAFEGERPITDLKIIPAAFADREDGGKLRSELVDSGKRWYALLRGGKQQHYTGATRGYPSENLDTRVVIDPRSYYSTKSDPNEKKMPDFDPFIQFEGRRRRVRDRAPPVNGLEGWVTDYGEELADCRCDQCEGLRPHPPPNFPWAEYDVLNPMTLESLELSSRYPDRDHRYLLCERCIWGFVLNTRTWAQLDPSYCREPSINVKAINSLVMPQDRKRMIRAIVQKYVDPMFTPGNPRENWGADYIKNKGEGQIFLLHGGPGVGKTFAKCISENIGRPLLALTCADFGTDEVQMEKNLLKWFKLAESWGAVMLLDEADVWLERRLVSDLKRNTMVAVFLRCIEYYRGILFLTSNRVGTFDDAFISRIHVVIKYDDLGETERGKIWEQFFEKLENERRDIFVDSTAKDYVLLDSKMRRTQWNGREIRNAFQTAVSLAEYRFHHENEDNMIRKVTLEKKDFEQVCKMSVDFKSYLSSLHHGDSESDRAMREGTR